MTVLTLTRGTVQHVHATRSRTTSGGVEVAIDHVDALDRELAGLVMDDDAAAVVDLTADEAVALAFDLLRASGRDLIAVATAMLDAADRAR
jgi:hypothetical protein